MNSIWLTFIIVHATAGVAAFVWGLLLLSPSRARKHGWLINAFVGSLVVLTLAVTAALISHWMTLAVVTKIIYSGLIVLSLYMIYRAMQAKTKLKSGAVDNSYIDDVGFPLISLFDGFTIVALIDLGTPIFIVVPLAVVAVIVGAQLLNRWKSKLTST